MPRYKSPEYGQTTMVAINIQSQLIEGSFEHALNDLIDALFALAKPSAATAIIATSAQKLRSESSEGEVLPEKLPFSTSSNDHHQRPSERADARLREVR